MIVVALCLIFMAVYFTNVGQVVHRTPTPTWLERLGR